LITIHLHQLKFYSLHGVHDEERVLGGDYEVNADIFIESKEKIEHLHQTIDYGIVYKIISDHMSSPIPLLETLAQNIANEIWEIDPKIKTIFINIKKLNPPIEHFTGSVSVSHTKQS
jgi:dihydroneopterin aldolase